MRPLFFDHADDPAVWNHPHQYLLGDDLLVNPVLEPGATTWTTYLPAGDWVDVWTGDPVSPRPERPARSRLDLLPVYCRTSAWPSLRDYF